MRPKDRFMLQAVVSLVIGIGPCLPSQNSGHGVRKKAELAILLVDGWGHPIRNASVQVETIEEPAARLRFSYPSTHTARVSAGMQRVVVYAPGFKELTRVAKVEESGLFLTLCLSLAPIEEVAREETAQLTGKVVGTAEGGRRWVRSVGLYCDSNIAVAVDADGAFAIPGLQPGRYLLMLFVDGALRATSQVDVRAFGSKVTLEAR